MSDMERVDRGDLKARSCSYRHCLSILPRVNSFRRKFNNMIYGSRLISRSPWTTLVVRGYVRILARQLVETPCTSAGRTLPLSCILRRPVGAADCTQAHRCGPGPQRHRFRVRARRMAGKSVLGVDGHYIDRTRLLIDSSDFYAADLAAPIDLGRQFDLVQSLEPGRYERPAFDGVF